MRGWTLPMGFGHFVTNSENDRVRFWNDKESALAELEEDGWILLGAFPRRYRRRSRLDRTFSLVRFLQ